MTRIALTDVLAVAVAGILLLAGGASVAAAQTTGAPTGSSDTYDLGDHRVVIQEASIQLTDIHVTGPGLPERSIDEASYTIDEATVSTEGVTATVDGHPVRIGQLALTVDDVGVTLENVSIGPPTPEER